MDSEALRVQLQAAQRKADSLEKVLIAERKCRLEWMAKYSELERSIRSPGVPQSPVFDPTESESSLSLLQSLSAAYSVVVKQRDQLLEENETLRKGVAAFDPEFFEQLEDMKYRLATLESGSQPASARSPLRPSSASRRTSQPSTARSSSASPLRQSAPAELSSASPARSALSATGAVPLQQPAWRPTGVNIDRGSSRRGGSPSDARDLDVRSSSPFSPKRERDSYVQTHGVHLRRSVVWAAARDAESGLPV